MNVESIKRRLLIKYPFFGSVVANSNFIAEPAVGTDGKNIYYNLNFIESITDDQQTFIFAHVICHIAFDHIFRSEGKIKFISDNKANYDIRLLCKCLNIYHSVYYYHINHKENSYELSNNFF